MTNSRDNFSKPTIDNLAKRVGYLCSNPNCKQMTVGSNTVANKSTLIGEAAHITAASLNGPRYDENLAEEKRTDIDNAIWLCCNCATLIDKDENKFTVPLLRKWKADAEYESTLKLSQQYNLKTNSTPYLEADLKGWSRMRLNKGISLSNPIEMHDGKLVIVAGPKPIIHWELYWNYTLIIYNNSQFPAFNVNIKSTGKVEFKSIEKLDKVNNIPPLGKVELKVEYFDFIEARHDIPDEMLKPRYPATMEDLLLEINYLDESRDTVHTTIVNIQKGEIVNTKLNVEGKFK